MKTSVLFNIGALTLLSTLLYTVVGQMVPQKEVHPPEVVELAEDMSTEEMTTIGQEIFNGKGLCSTCHTIGKTGGGLRFPDLAGIGTRAANEIPGMTGLDYLAQSLYEPDVYIVSGFNSGMPAINKPPIALTDGEILTVISYLQSLGGTPTVTMETKVAYVEGGSLEGEASADAVEATPAVDVAGAVTGVEDDANAGTAAASAAGGLLAQRGCTTCHHVDQAGSLRARSLYDIGGRMQPSEILLALTYHPESAANTLTVSELQSIVDQLAELKGAP